MRQNRVEALGSCTKAFLVTVLALVFVFILEIGAFVAGLLVLPDQAANRFADAFHPMISGRALIPGSATGR